MSTPLRVLWLLTFTGVALGIVSNVCLVSLWLHGDDWREDTFRRWNDPLTMGHLRLTGVLHVGSPLGEQVEIAPSGIRWLDRSGHTAAVLLTEDPNDADGPRLRLLRRDDPSLTLGFSKGNPLVGLFSGPNKSDPSAALMVGDQSAWLSVQNRDGSMWIWPGSDDRPVRSEGK
jgi:hypothetical protein